MWGCGGAAFGEGRMSGPASKWSWGVITRNADRKLKGKKEQVGADFALSTKEEEWWQAADSLRGAADCTHGGWGHRGRHPLALLPTSLWWQV